MQNSPSPTVEYHRPLPFLYSESTPDSIVTIASLGLSHTLRCCGPRLYAQVPWASAISSGALGLGHELRCLGPRPYAQVLHTFIHRRPTRPCTPVTHSGRWCALITLPDRTIVPNNNSPFCSGWLFVNSIVTYHHRWPHTCLRSGPNTDPSP